MTLLQNFVLETSNNPGVGDFILSGAPQNRRSFSQAFPDGGKVFYFADDGTQAEWGIGTLTVGSPATLARTIILGNTYGNTGVLRFTAGVEVYNEVPAAFLPLLGEDGRLTLSSLTVADDILVPDIDDWTAQKAVGAAAADKRYIRQYADTSAAYITQMTLRSGGILAALANGTWFTFQPAGDYATTDQATTAQSSANSAQGTANAALAAANSANANKLDATDGTATRMAINYGSMTAKFQDDGNFVLYSGGTAVFSVNSATISWNGHGFAFLDSLPMDSSQKILVDQVSGVASGGRVNFSSAFSSPPKVIAQNFGTGDANCHTATTDTGGFTLHINNGGSSDITYIAIGGK